MMHGIMMMHGHGMHESWWTGWMVLGTIWALLLLAFWVLVLIGFGLLVRWLWRVTSERTMIKTPLEILKTRYSRGEISRQEFEVMKQDLGAT